MDPLSKLRREQGIGCSFPGAWMSILRRLFRTHDGRKALLYIRLAQHWYAHGRHGRARWLQGKLRREFGCYISLKAEIGEGLRLPHPVGIVVGDGARIGKECAIYQHVTLGGARVGDWQAGNYPTLDDGVTIFAGSVVLGSVRVGSNAQIGANSVVLTDVPASRIAVGAPAMIKGRVDTEKGLRARSGARLG